MKMFALSIASSLLIIGPATAQTVEPLAALRWEKRPLLLFSKSRSDASLDKQVDLLRQARPELRERDMIVLRTSGQEETRSSIGYTPINRGMNRELRKRYTPGPRGLTVILIGKDGDEKRRWNRVVQPQEIFELIDAMPMRQGEISEKQSSSDN